MGNRLRNQSSAQRSQLATSSLEIKTVPQFSWRIGTKARRLTSARALTPTEVQDAPSDGLSAGATEMSRGEPHRRPNITRTIASAATIVSQTSRLLCPAI